MRTNTLALVLVSLFTISLTGCLTEQDADEESEDGVVANDPDDGSSDPSDDENGCRLRKDTDDLECPDPE